MQSKAGKKSSVISTLGHPSSPMQASLQGRQQRKLISGYLFCAIKHRFSADKGVLFVIRGLKRYGSIETSKVVGTIRVISSRTMNLI